MRKSLRQSNGISVRLTKHFSGCPEEFFEEKSWKTLVFNKSWILNDTFTEMDENNLAGFSKQPPCLQKNIVKENIFFYNYNFSLFSDFDKKKFCLSVKVCRQVFWSCILRVRRVVVRDLLGTNFTFTVNIELRAITFGRVSKAELHVYKRRFWGNVFFSKMCDLVFLPCFEEKIQTFFKMFLRNCHNASRRSIWERELFTEFEWKYTFMQTVETVTKTILPVGKKFVRIKKIFEKNITL